MPGIEVHGSSVVEKGAVLGDGVRIGPFCYIGGKVRLGDECVLASHVAVLGNTRIGKRCRIYQSAVIGGDPQDLKYGREDTLLEMGDDNVIREFATINKGTVGGGGVTRVGNGNLIMAYVHIAHDCLLGNNIIVANAANFSGHIVVEDYARISGLAALHHYLTVGTLSFIGGASKVAQDVPPYCLVDGNPARVRGLNLEGLKRAGMSRRTITALKEAFRILYRSELNASQALKELEAGPLYAAFPEVKHLVEFVAAEVAGWRGRGREALRPDRPKAGFNLERDLRGAGGVSG